MRIGIAGITTSGKSTLAKALTNVFKGAHCCVDDFYYTQDFPMMTFKGKTIIDWETPNCIHWDKFEEYCERQTADIVFIDSYLLFYSKKVADSLDAVIILQYQPEDFQEALARRIRRFSNQAVPSDYVIHPDASETHWEAAYFTEIAWKFAMDYPQYREPKDLTKPILRLKAVNPLGDNINKAINFVNGLLMNSV
ncbi:hypothetical protein TVAG_256770 [Trichomonas vaginalis G3]|uniref:Uncharacterized protein n=1 Tax=Trichomonas vaginalis (strain ATCC PRA-98 / G3) TaxID=412133 RepID=A2FEY3_TRIV3|nr:ribosylnicotinamide kinase protein [Trichomonas vaginalis G3]EAX96537.1 hypothetical protein TVAG_256770 [Trichomonas vaginalis G3]KAI5541095.1 ribosylnicotinamide kinase protein [Trichomonas vaginalis G3]|eukprot:XP_001309467.1 hypothetical protein [Trichomonas vaginalis G3]